ncbi:hypothetical protein [Nonomuraea sp. NPDC001699]
MLSKLGMTWEGRHRHTALIRAGWRDSELFSIIEDEWRAVLQRQSMLVLWSRHGDLCRQ